MKELEEAIVNSFRKMRENGTIEKIIEAKLEKTVSEIFDEVLRSYSDFGKKLKETVETTLKVDFSQLGFDGYNDIVLKIIQRKMDSAIGLVVRAKLEEGLDDLFKTPPTEIKLSELVNQMKGDEFDEREECTCIVKHRDRGYGRVYLDECPNKNYDECKYEIAFDDKGTVYQISIDGYKQKEKLFVGPFFGFERTLFQLYAAKTKLIVDEDAVELSYPEHN